MNRSISRAVVIAALLGTATLGSSVVAQDTKAVKGAEKTRAKIEVDEKKRTVTIEAVVAEQDSDPQRKGSIEYILVADGGKDHESLFVTRADPLELSEALRRIGLEKGMSASSRSPPRGMDVNIWLERVASRSGEKSGTNAKRLRVDDLVVRRSVDKDGKETLEPLSKGHWKFTGSRSVDDDDSKRMVLECTATKSLVGLHFQDRSPLLQNSRAEARTQNIYEPNKKLLPKKGTLVKLVFERHSHVIAKGTVRAHLFISGRVQGVSFRAFTQRSARRSKLVGWVMNLADGRVEGVIEGPKDQVDALVKKLHRGPRAARVEKLERIDESPYGGYSSFDIFFLGS